MEDIKQIQEFFSKPLEEGKQLDQVDFAKVVKAVEQTGHPVTVLLVPKFNEIEVLTGMDAPDDILRDLSNAVDSLGYGRNDIFIAADSSNLSRREYSDIRRVNGGAKDYFEESVNEMDMNDPVLMKMRAAKMKADKLAKMRAANAGDDGNDKFFDNAKKIAFLKKEREQLMRDMEQEAEPEGGPIADEYGSKLNRIDAAIAKLSGRKEMTYDQAIAEGEGKMPTQDQVDKFFALTQNETHYLNSKPVAGQEATFNLMKIEPWDEYDLSNWNSLVRKAKQRGKSIDENDKASTIKDKIEKLRKLSNSGEIDGDEFLDKFNPLQKQLKSIDEDNSYARVSKPRFKKDKNSPNFLNVYIDYDLGPGGNSVAFGKETMSGQIRRLSSAKARKVAHDIALDLEANFDLEDIEVTDLENGKVRIFAVSDDFIDMDPNMLSESSKGAMNYFSDLKYNYQKAFRYLDVEEREEYKQLVKDFFSKLQVDNKVRAVGLEESLNPEVSNALDRFIKAMAKRYDYSEQDAVYAIMAALKQRDFDGVNEYQTGIYYKGEETKDKAKDASKSALEKVRDMIKKMIKEGDMSLDDEAKAYFLAKVKQGEIDTLPENPKAAFLAQMMKDQMDHDGETLRRERGLEETASYIAETIKLGQNLNEDLCEKGKRYIKARQAAGEKSSAYLSGRAVRVCKGQIDWPKKGKK